MRITAYTKIFNITLLSTLALSLAACVPTKFKPAHHTSAYECQRLQSRALMTLEQERACRMGQQYNLRSDSSSPKDNK